MEQIKLFDETKDQSYCKQTRDQKGQGIILSASRMTDMPKYYPDELIEEVEKRRVKGVEIHTLVLWTKHPSALLEKKLKEYLLKLKQEGIQLFLECTITGMGGKTIGDIEQSIQIEPNVPSCEEAISSLKEVCDLIGGPQRIKLRIDPIITLQNRLTKECFTNLKYVKYIIEQTSRVGIKEYVFSFLESGIYQKVDKRFVHSSWSIKTPDENEKQIIYSWLQDKASSYGVRIKPCCVSGLEESRCIDGYALESLHDERKRVNLKEPRKRPRCACAHTIDIGGWPPKRCYSGCKYCYANVVI